MKVQKDSEILVKVDEALADLLVVSYCNNDKKYQGVLLELSKNNLPYGVYSLHPAFSKEKNPENDNLHSVSQRFTYQEDGNNATLETNKQTAKARLKSNPKMTVRLRPRNILCSNCQGVCNENNENVGVKKRRLNNPDVNDNDTLNKDMEKKLLMGSMLIPKLSRLRPNEITSALKGNITKQDDSQSESPDRNNMDNATANETSNKLKVNNLTKNEHKSFFKSAKTLKICFGEGEGTVVKIPPIGIDNEDSGVCDMIKQSEGLEKKAARRAKRKARKLSKKTEDWVSQKHKGALSPRNNVCDSTTNQTSIEKKHKHKVKRRKKDKLAKVKDENASKQPDDINYFRAIKQHDMNKNSEALNTEMDASGDWEGGVSDFPVPTNEAAVGSPCQVSPGDIVWGKVVGFPWWPGKVLSLTASSKAHVIWFASTTSSLMPCDSLCPFLEDYKLRFNKRKRGVYREAVKLAAQEAKLNESLDE